MAARKIKPRMATPECVASLKIIADPTRLSVLELLMDSPRQVLELAEALDVEQSLMSHHLKQLRGAGLVETTRVGKAVRYALVAAMVVSKPQRAIHLGCCDVSFAAGPKTSS